MRKTVKNNLKAISKDNSGQGAAEYILLFGGVIVIALAGLLIYRSYFSNNASGLNATQDISSIRNNVTSIY
ncbi:class III signal peptide-containing protein [Methanobrevibacter sp.]|uniref:class III signal peptide-containing protein n=1 Tax=Methanobrevibacter sp. TaxID=66852 RepID=UPI0025CDEDBB|nr:class III signal peptide-containing protein [Methanobrevibacter sp.]